MKSIGSQRPGRREPGVWQVGIRAPGFSEIGANQSVIDFEFCKLLNEQLVKLDKPYLVETANGNVVKINEALVNGKITLFKHNMLAGLNAVIGIEKKKLGDTHVVADSPDVFLDELPSLPPERVIEFNINLVPSTIPIVKSSYRLALTEIKDLKKHLDESLA
ncbi:hypothetical protein E3N88_17415 [Mikania micrantha]|uniref:Uncharacterized protein n=1 Tax=Mikania micrantha TaxID=192012 RepID=A0A5N6NT78_9ASTR|nr:hypothetical protein E3N88_17415 [Mikania micrantha]